MSAAQRKVDFCWLCKKVGGEVKAKSYCVECKELCASCTIRHSKQTLSKSHRTVDIKDKPSEAELKRLREMYCSKHTKEELRLYCCDCKVVLCMLCRVAYHNKHECQLLSEKVEIIKKEVNCYVDVYSRCKTDCKDRLSKVTARMEDLLENLSATESAVRKRCNEIRRSLDECEKELLLKLNTVKETHLKEITARKELDEAFCAEIETFLARCHQLLTSGSDCDIVEAADDIQQIATEISRSKTKCDKKPFAEMSLKFVESLGVTSAGIKNFIGEIEYANRSMNESFQNKSSIRDVAKSKNKIVGVTVLDDEIFVIREKQLQVEVYDSNSLTELRIIELPDMKSPKGLASCSYNKTLYISESKLMYIHNVNVISNTITYWKVNNALGLTGISVTAGRNLLVTIWRDDEGAVVEYNDKGQTLQEIVFDESVLWPWQTIQLSRKRFIIRHGRRGDQVCVINNKGNVMTSYDRTPGKNDCQLNYPLSLTIDNNRENIFVADCVNNAIVIVILNLELKYIGKVNTSIVVQQPHSLHLDLKTDRLITGQKSGDLLCLHLKPLGYITDRCMNEPLRNQASISAAAKSKKAIVGVTVLDDEIFVVREEQPQINVYILNSLTMLRIISVPYMKSPEGLAGCAYHKTLYISDSGLKCIHRVDLLNNSITHWKVSSVLGMRGLSITAARNLLITIWLDTCGAVVEYNSNGQLLQQIEFDESIIWPWETIQLLPERFIVCHGGAVKDQLHRVCVINTKGNIMASYGNAPGKTKGQLNHPLSLTVDDNRKNIFVADCDNNAIVILDFDLKYIGKVNPFIVLQEPMILHFDLKTDRLVVGQQSGDLICLNLNSMI